MDNLIGSKVDNKHFPVVIIDLVGGVKLMGHFNQNDLKLHYPRLMIAQQGPRGTVNIALVPPWEPFMTKADECLILNSHTILYSIVVEKSNKAILDEYHNTISPIKIPPTGLVTA